MDAGFFMSALIMRRRCVIIFQAKLALLLFLAFNQGGDLLLQAINLSLLTHHHIVQALNSVILKGQTAFQLIDPRLDTHSSPGKKLKSSVNTIRNLAKTVARCSAL